MFEAFELTSRDVIMTVFPAFGRVGFAWIAAGFMFGARNVLDGLQPGRGAAPDRERKGDASAISCRPWRAMLLADPSLPSRDLSVRCARLVFAGSMFPAPLRERVAAALCPAIYEYYGMQETGTLTVSTPEDRKLQPDSVGVPLCSPRCVSSGRTEPRRARRTRRNRRPLARDLHRLFRQSGEDRPRRSAAASSTPAISAR